MKIFAFIFFCLGNLFGRFRLPGPAAMFYTWSANSSAANASFPLFNLGNLYQEKGDLENAIQSFQAVTKVEPENIDAWINLGRALDDHGSHAAAVSSYNTALKMDPRDVVAWSNRGNSLRSLGKHDDAAQSYERALQLDPRDGAAVVGLSVCQVYSGDQRGLAALTELYEQTGAPWILLERAKVLTAAGRGKQAFEDYQKLVTTDPDNHQVWLHRAKFLAKASKPNESLASYDRALELSPDYPASLFAKAQLLANLKRFDEAKPLVEKYKSKLTSAEKKSSRLKKLCAKCGVE